MTFTQFRDGIQHGVYKIIDPSVKLMIKIGVTPNMITTCGFLGNAVAAAMIVYSSLYVPQNDYSIIGWAGFLIIFSSIFDMIDGYLARTGNMCSTFGAFYDSVLDRFCELFTLSGLAFYFMQFGYTWQTVVVFLSLISSIMVSYVRARAEGLDIECKVGLMQRPERVVVTSLGLMLAGILQDCVSFDPMWIMIVPQILIAVLAGYTVIVRILHVKKAMGN